MAPPSVGTSLLDRVLATCRRRHFSRHTEKRDRQWIVRYGRFHDTTHPRELNADDVRTFLNHLAVHRNVAASTRTRPSMPSPSSTTTCSTAPSTLSPTNSVEALRQKRNELQRHTGCFTFAKKDLMTPPS